MKFIRENDTYFGVLQNEVYNNRVCEELLYCEITKTAKGWELAWEDKFSEKHYFQEIRDAQQYAILVYPKRTPHVNGKTWEINEE